MQLLIICAHVSLLFLFRVKRRPKRRSISVQAVAVPQLFKYGILGDLIRIRDFGKKPKEKAKVSENVMC